jgi:hypothetical protein
MKKTILWMCAGSLMVFGGCSNVHYIVPPKECSSLTRMDVCENTKERDEVPSLDIRGDKRATEYPDYY